VNAISELVLRAAGARIWSPSTDPTAADVRHHYANIARRAMCSASTRYSITEGIERYVACSAPRSRSLAHQGTSSRTIAALVKHP